MLSGNLNLDCNILNLMGLNPTMIPLPRLHGYDHFPCQCSWCYLGILSNCLETYISGRFMQVSCIKNIFSLAISAAKWSTQLVPCHSHLRSVPWWHNPLDPISWADRRDQCLHRCKKIMDATCEKNGKDTGYNWPFGRMRWVSFTIPWISQVSWCCCCFWKETHLNFFWSLRQLFMIGSTVLRSAHQYLMMNKSLRAGGCIKRLTMGFISN